MTKIIKVDFKNKCREGEFDYSRYLCHACDTRYEYDSRVDKKEDKVPYLKLALSKNKGTINICKYCAQYIGDSLKDS